LIAVVVNLLFASGCQQGVAKPVRARSLGLGDRVLNFPELVKTEPYPDEFSQRLTLGLLWSANFTGHTKLVDVAQKLFLPHYIFRATDIQVSTEILLSLERVAGTAAGESELTNSLPVRAGASRRESEMNTGTLQARSLAIEAAGDFFKGKITPKIRLSGQWLERAGFRPGHRVQVLMEQPGILTLRFLEQGKEVAP
jgi:hypothetical protein